MLLGAPHLGLVAAERQVDAPAGREHGRGRRAVQEVRDQHAVPLSVSRLRVQVGQSEVRVAEDNGLVRFAKLGGGERRGVDSVPHNRSAPLQLSSVGCRVILALLLCDMEQPLTNQDHLPRF